MSYWGLFNWGRITEPERVKGALPLKLAPISVFEEVGGRYPEGFGELAQRSGVRVRPVTALYTDYSAGAYAGGFG